MFGIPYRLSRCPQRDSQQLKTPIGTFSAPRMTLTRRTAMAYDPRAVANVVLDVAEANGFAVSNMGLNKILFFSHGWSLGCRTTPLVSTFFEAWRHGPVLPLIYRQFSSFGSKPITSRAFRLDRETGNHIVVVPALNPADEAFVSDMTLRFGVVDPLILSNLSHEAGGPWDQVWNGRAEINPGMAIPNDMIRVFFESRIRGESRRYAH